MYWAAVIYGDDDPHGVAADALVAQCCARLQRQGWRVAGLLQERAPRPGGGKPAMLLHDLGSGTRICISQDLGPHSHACSLNPAALAQASAVLRQALHEGADVVLTNRFGEQEACGAGFVAELVALAQAGVAVLTVAAQRHAPAWRHFTGGVGLELAPTPAALDGWCAQLLPPRERA